MSGLPSALIFSLLLTDDISDADVPVYVRSSRSLSESSSCPLALSLGSFLLVDAWSSFLLSSSIAILFHKYAIILFRLFCKLHRNVLKNYRFCKIYSESIIITEEIYSPISKIFDFLDMAIHLFHHQCLLLSDRCGSNQEKRMLCFSGDHSLFEYQ